MSMRILFESYFWNVAVASVGVVLPVFALFMIFRLVHDLLWK